MFSFMRKKQGDVISHWYALVPEFSMSAKEFYSAIEGELKRRMVPGLQLERIEFAEGGVLSSERTYLRMQRETLVFDVCAAPFGKSYFFSCRFADIPIPITIWHLLACGFGGIVAFGFVLRYLDFWGVVFFILMCSGGVYALRNAVSLGLRDLDATLSKAPILGAIYIRFFRRETYYREDTRLMYCDTVNDVAKSVVEHVTGASGIEFIRFNERSPLLEELYRPRLVETKAPAKNNSNVIDSQSPVGSVS